MKRSPDTTLANVPAAAASELPKELQGLLAEAFERYGAEALWSKRADGPPTPGRGRAVAVSLLREGPSAARNLAKHILEVCDALDPAADEHPQDHRDPPGS